MPPKRAGDADDGARGKKRKHKSLFMLQKVEMREWNVCKDCMSTMASDHLLCKT